MFHFLVGESFLPQSLKTPCGFVLVMRKVLIILTVLLLVGCIVRPAQEEIKPVRDRSGLLDATKVDIFDLLDKKQIAAENISVKGVALGDDLSTVIEAFGVPEFIDEFTEEGIMNVRYESEKNVSSVVFNLVNGSVERMTVRGGFNPYLIGRSKMELWQLENITAAFGKPDVSFHTQFARVYEYHDIGLELFHRRKQLQGFALVHPK